MVGGNENADNILTRECNFTWLVEEVVNFVTLYFKIDLIHNQRDGTQNSLPTDKWNLISLFSEEIETVYFPAIVTSIDEVQRAIV